MLALDDVVPSVPLNLPSDGGCSTLRRRTFVAVPDWSDDFVITGFLFMNDFLYVVVITRIHEFWQNTATRL